MNNQFLGKLTGLGTLSLALLAMTGCLGTKNLSANITDDGSVDMQNIVFPELDTAWQKNGQFPNSENLTKIRPGIAKDDLYQLIGTPHFSEGSNAREWDYILKFYDNNQQVKVCQYKVIFDKEYKGQEFYWSPADCPPEKIAVVQSIPERTNLSADTLFEFNKSDAQNMLPQGKRELDELAQKLREYQQMGQVMVSIIGHTDRKGDNAYNMNLSLQRAQTIGNYLVSQGVNPNSISATGEGESQPIQQCSTALSRQQEIDCLQPNRRVTIDVNVIK